MLASSSKFLQVSRSSATISTVFRSLSTQVLVDLENAKSYEEIPGPKGVFDFIKKMSPGGGYYKLDMDELVRAMRKDYGNILKIPGFMGQKPIVLSFLPEDIEKILRNEGKFPNRRPLESIDYFRTQLRPELYPAGAGLLTSQGQEWYNFRSKVQQLLMQPRATKVYVPGIDSVACDFVKKIRRIRDKNDEMPENFYELLNDWALESVALIALDTRLGVMENPEVSNISALLKKIFQATYDYDIQPSVWRYFKTPGFKKAMGLYEENSNEIKKFIAAAVERYEKNPTADENEAGVLEKLIKIDKDIGVAMAEDMLLAGVDTTSTAVTSVLYQLAKYPDKQEKLREEIIKILPEKDSKLTASSFNSVPYLRAVIKEALRLKPVTNGTLRALDHDTVLQGYKIPKNTDILLSTSILALEEDHFKQSKDFIPERWLKNNNDPKCPHAKDAHPFSYLPFGFGSRMCVGRRFAELEVEVLTARIIREFKLEWHHPDLTYKSITINTPSQPLRFTVKDL